MVGTLCFTIGHMSLEIGESNLSLSIRRVSFLVQSSRFDSLTSSSAQLTDHHIVFVFRVMSRWNETKIEPLCLQSILVNGKGSFLSLFGLDNDR